MCFKVGQRIRHTFNCESVEGKIHIVMKSGRLVTIVDGITKCMPIGFYSKSDIIEEGAEMVQKYKQLKLF